MIWVFVGCILLIYSVVQIIGNRKRTREEVGVFAVPHGNTSIFIDKNGNVDIIPFSVDKFKRGKASGCPISISKPFLPAELGSAIRKGLELSGSKKIIGSEELMKHLGFYHWKEYSKGRKSISVLCQGQGIVLNSTIRRRDGSYDFRTQGYEKVLPEKLSDEALGKAVLDFMGKSRVGS